MAMTGGTAVLVKTGYKGGDTSYPIKLYVYYKTSQDVTNNRSTITLGMYFTQNSGSVGAWAKSSNSYLGTTSNTFDGSFPKTSAKTYWIKENVTMTVNHNADGTGKATIYWKWGVNSSWAQIQNPSGSFKIDLPKINRTFTATFGANGGLAPSASSVTFTGGAAIGTLPTIQRLGYTFLGWYGGARSSYTLSSSTSNYNYQAIYTGVKSGTSYGINIATASLTSGSATQFTTLIYDFTTQTQLAASVQSFGSNKRYMIDCPSSANSSHDIQIIVYAGISGSTANQAAKYSNVSVGPKLTSSTVMPAANTYYYAFWQKNNYTITYNANGGTVSSTTQTVTYGNTATLKTPTRTGYTFKGWYANFDGSTAINVGRIYNFTGKLAFHLEAYSTNWANLDSQRLISCTESGGFNIEPNGGYIQFAAYDSGVGYKTLKTSKTWASLSAGWHSFDFVFNGSTVTGYIDDTSYGSTAAFSSGKIGYNSTNPLFLGAEAGTSPNTPAGNYLVGRIRNFQISDSSTKLTSTSNKFRMPAQNITLIAEWEPITITITLDKQGGSGGTDKFYYKYGINKFYSNSACTTEITAITKPTKTGYTFVHYYGDGTCGGTNGERYVAYDSTNFASDLCTDIYKNATLYASWTPTTYTNSIAHWMIGLKNSEGNNGDKSCFLLGSTSFTKKYGETADFTSSRAVTIPNGFYLSNLGTSSFEGSWKSYTIPHNRTQEAKGYSVEYYYAYYNYTVSYTMNGGINNSANPSNYNVLYGFTLANPTKRGYSFDGWYLNGTKITGINTSAVSFSSVDALYTSLNSRTTGNITIEARWTPLTYTISYNANGGSGTMTSHTVSYGSSIKIKDNTFTRTGYDFAGWTTKSDGSNDGHGWSNGTIPNVVGWSGTWNYINGEYGIADQKLVLYARWQLKTYTVSYNGNGNIVSNVPSSQTKTHGTNITLSNTSPTRTRYKFLGWSTSSTATSATYAPGATFSTNANTTLYAVWQILDKNIYLYKTGKIDAVDFKTVSTVTELFDKNGYVYGTGFVTHSESNIYIGKDGKIYAKEFIKY